MWLGDQLTVKGIGNGTSILIFVNIISRVPATIASMITLKEAGSASIVEIVLFGVFIVLMLATILYFSLSERRIPVQYAGKFAVGNKDGKITINTYSIKYNWISCYCNNICNVSNGISKNNSTIIWWHIKMGKVDIN